MSGSKIPSFFRTARYQRFNYEPRYYDPIKEDLMERESRIREELNLEPLSGRKVTGGHNLRGAFQKSRSASKNDPALLRSVILLILLDLAYYFWSGSRLALYGMFLIPGIYIFFKILKSRR